MLILHVLPRPKRSMRRLWMSSATALHPTLKAWSRCSISANSLKRRGWDSSERCCWTSNTTSTSQKKKGLRKSYCDKTLISTLILKLCFLTVTLQYTETLNIPSYQPVPMKIWIGSATPMARTCVWTGHSLRYRITVGCYILPIRQYIGNVWHVLKERTDLYRNITLVEIQIAVKPIYQAASSKLVKMSVTICCQCPVIMNIASWLKKSITLMGHIEN